MFKEYANNIESGLLVRSKAELNLEMGLLRLIIEQTVLGEQVKSDYDPMTISGPGDVVFQNCARDQRLVEVHTSKLPFAT